MGLLDTLLGVGRRRINGAAFRRPRAHRRVSMEERAELRRSKDGSAHTVILSDLSPGGARIATPLRFAVGEDFTLIIAAGRRAPFTLGCSVVCARGTGGRLHRDYGVRFVRVRPGDEERLAHFVASHDDARVSGSAFI